MDETIPDMQFPGENQIILGLCRRIYCSQGIIIF